FLEELGAKVRLDHVDVGRVALEILSEVLPTARLRVDSVFATVRKDRAESAPLDARDRELAVDDDPGHALLLRATEDASLRCVLEESFLMCDWIDPPKEATEPLLRARLERECKVVGIPRVDRADLLGERAQARVEPAADEVRDRG